MGEPTIADHYGDRLPGLDTEFPLSITFEEHLFKSFTINIENREDYERFKTLPASFITEFLERIQGLDQYEFNITTEMLKGMVN